MLGAVVVVLASWPQAGLLAGRCQCHAARASPASIDERGMASEVAGSS